MHGLTGKAGSGRRFHGTLWFFWFIALLFCGCSSTSVRVDGVSLENLCIMDELELDSTARVLCGGSAEKAKALDSWLKRLDRSRRRRGNSTAYLKIKALS